MCSMRTVTKYFKLKNIFSWKYNFKVLSSCTCQKNNKNTNQKAEL